MSPIRSRMKPGLPTFYLGGRSLEVILFVVLCLWASVSVFGFGAVYSYIWAPLDISIFLVLACTVLLWALNKIALPRPVLMWPMLAFGILVVGQLVFHDTRYPGLTWTGLPQLAGCGAIFYLSYVAFLHPPCRRYWSWFLWGMAGVLAAESILQLFNGHKYIYWFHNATYAWPVGPFVYHNHFAGCMDLLLPVVLIRSYADLRRRSPDYWIVLLRRSIVPLLAVIALILSLSRGGMLIFGFELSLLVVFWMVFFRHRHDSRSVWVLTLLLLILLMFSGTVVSRLQVRFGHTFSSSNLWERLQVDVSCWHIFLHHPLIGVGFNTFSVVYPKYQRFDNGKRWVFAHDDYAQLLAETGLLGFLCALWVLAMLLRGLWCLCRVLPMPSWIYISYFVSLLGFAAYALGDFQFHAPGLALLFWLMAGAAMAAADSTKCPSAVAKISKSIQA